MENEIRAFCIEKGWAHVNLVLRGDSMHLQLMPNEVEPTLIKNTRFTAERISTMIEKIHTSKDKELAELWKYIDWELMNQVASETDIRIVKLPQRWLPYYEYIQREYLFLGWEAVILSKQDPFTYRLEFKPVTMKKTYKFQNKETNQLSSIFKDIFSKIKKYFKD